MVMSGKYYTKLKAPLLDYKSLYEKLVNKDSELPWHSSAITYDFKLIKMSMTYVENNETLSAIYDKFKFSTYIFKLPANYNYNWHIDSDRGLSINMPLNNHINSHTCFLTDDSLGSSNKFHRLDWDPGYFYLFNTQRMHSVLNLNEDRYFFSMTFDQTKNDLSYEMVLNYCKEKELIC